MSSKRFITRNGLYTSILQIVSANSANSMALTLSDIDALTITGDSGDLVKINDTTSGTTLFVSGTISAAGIDAPLSGNAATATKLQTARTINGTAFDGTSDITTSKWGTSRNITLGSTTKSADGSINLSWSLAEIGAAPTVHTHVISDITGLQTSLDGKISSSEKGAANGVAPLGSDSKISSIYLPSYVDDVLDYANLASFPATGEAGKIYVATDTNKTYRWSGTVYVEISPSPGTTDSLTEGSTNLYFTDVRARTAVVQDTIVDAITDRAPSQNAVFDALAGKAALSHTHSAADITSGILLATRGGTGIGSYTTSNYIRAASSTTLEQRTPAQVLSDIGAASSTHNHTLDSLSNVSISANTSGEILKWSGTAWINNTLAEAGISAVGHTHVISDITGLQTSLDGKISSSEKGAANGVAPLGSDSKISSIYLPSYVDDVLDYANLASFPATGETGKIYVATNTNKTYRWSGTVYVEISPSPGTTDSLTEGSTNLYYTNARARAAISVSGIGLSYNNSTGVITSNATNLNTISTLVARDASGNFSAGTITASLSGNASTSTKLQVARTINGTSFDGSANITTLNWGTARTITIGATGKSVDGASDVNWTLADLGLGNVENTALSTWAGSTNITTLGTIQNLVYFNAGIDLTNENITNVNNITFADPGSSEGLYWGGGNGWRIYESPDNLTNGAGNLQFVMAGSRFFTIKSDGTSEFTGDVTATDFIRVSDKRLKTDIKPFSASNPLTPKIYKMIDSGIEDIGFIADDVEKIYPHAVKTVNVKGDCYKAIAYDKLTVILASQLNDAMNRIHILEQKLI